MVSWRVAAAGGLLLLLLVAQQASAQAAEKVISASGAVQPSTKKKPPHQQPKTRKCTEAQKQDILHECRGYVTAGSHIILPDLDCIVDLLTSEERSRYNANRIKHLNEMCPGVQPTAKRSPPSPRIRKCTHAQKVNILHACWRWVKLDHGHRVLPLHNDVYDLCCNAARDVRALDMNCIVDLLTGE
uniref:Bifunctional inhibitor/plant lipid transfer protein/seed storage helical domain-containing protein n=1 Tax=Oryza meridionalis TaxID=40149 RepID=A0A0E0FAT2_9ORYZ